MSLTPQPLRKRDRVRKILGKTRSRSANIGTQLTATPARTQSQRPADGRIHSSILADALEELSLEDRDTIRRLLPKDAVGVSAAFEGVRGCAKELQRQCADEKWSWRYKDRQIYPSEQMDKVLRFLDRFKSVIDLASNADPVHIGLPWTGIRIILEVCDISAHLSLSMYTDTLQGRTSRTQSAGCPGNRHGIISLHQQPA